MRINKSLFLLLGLATCGPQPLPSPNQTASGNSKIAYREACRKLGSAMNFLAISNGYLEALASQREEYIERVRTHHSSWDKNASVERAPQREETLTRENTQIEIEQMRAAILNVVKPYLIASVTGPFEKAAADSVIQNLQSEYPFLFLTPNADKRYQETLTISETDLFLDLMSYRAKRLLDDTNCIPPSIARPPDKTPKAPSHQVQQTRATRHLIERPANAG